MTVKRTRYSNQKLNELMAKQGRMNQWLAAELRVHESYVSKLRSGAKPLTPELALRIATVFGIPVGYFADTDGEAA